MASREGGGSEKESDGERERERARVRAREEERVPSAQMFGSSPAAFGQKMFGSGLADVCSSACIEQGFGFRGWCRSGV